MPDDKPASIEINDVTVSGPTSKLNQILAPIQQQQAEEAARPTPAVDEKRRPNPRHTGIFELLGLFEKAHTQVSDKIEVEEARGVTTVLSISRVEQEGLRTVGFSGPSIDTLAKAVDLVLLWRNWDLKDQERRRR